MPPEAMAHFSDRPCVLVKFRRLQYLSSSFNTYMMLNKALFAYQFVMFTVGFVSAIVGKFYFEERYHLYGCRKNYQDGFPEMCQERSQPSGIDAATGRCYAVAALSTFLIVVVPVMWVRCHWKCWLARDISFFLTKSFKEINVEDVAIYSDFLTMLIYLEGAHSTCQLRRSSSCHMPSEKAMCRQRFLCHVGSCIWSELFFKYHFRKRWTFVLASLVMFIIFAVLPTAVPLVTHGWSGLVMLFASTLFLICPLFCGSLLLVLLCCSLAHLTVPICIFLVMWTCLVVGALLFAYTRETHDEVHLVSMAYRTELVKYVQSVVEGDVKLLLALRGYGEPFLLGKMKAEMKTAISDMHGRMRDICYSA